MIVQCRVCRKIRDNGRFRQPWPGELPLEVKHTYCPGCAKEALAAIQRGEVPFSYKDRPATRRSAPARHSAR